MAKRSDSAAGGADRPRILYLLTAEISSVLVRGQLDAVHAAGFDVTVGVGLDSGKTDDPGAGWDESADINHVPFQRQPSPFADLRALRSAIRLIRSTRPDIVNASTPKAGLLGMVAARWCRVPVRVYHLRGLRFETTTGWRRRLLVTLERCAAGMSTHVIINSESARDVAVAERISHRRPPVMIGSGSGNGIDVDHYSPDRQLSRDDARSSFGLPLNTFVLGFIGRLTSDKGIAVLLDVFEHLTAERDDLHLLLVGDVEPGDPVGPDVEQRIAARRDVSHLPWVPETAVIYPAIDVLIFPSEREGLPNVPLQAQAAGVPVIATTATGTVDAVQDGVSGVLVEPGNQMALALAIESLIDDPLRRVSLGADGPAWVRDRFAQDAFWDELITTYRRWLSTDE